MLTSLGDDVKFGNYPVFYKIEKEDVIIKCKGVYLSYNRYKEWKDNPTKNVLGYNEEGKECKILERDGIVQISCLKDTRSNLNKIELLIKYILKNEYINKKNKKSAKGKKFNSD